MAINKTNYIARLVEQKKLADLKDYFEKNILDSKVSCDCKEIRNIHVTITDMDGRMVGEYHFLNFSYFKTVTKRIKSSKIHIEDEMVFGLFIDFMKKIFPTFEKDYLYELNEKSPAIR